MLPLNSNESRRSSSILSSINDLPLNSQAVDEPPDTKTKLESLLFRSPSHIGLEDNEATLYLYSEVSKVFTSEEFLKITAYYDICGLNAWKLIVDIPAFKSRGMHILDICERLEDHKMAHWTTNSDKLESVVNEITKKIVESDDPATHSGPMAHESLAIPKQDLISKYTSISFTFLMSSSPQKLKQQEERTGKETTGASVKIPSDTQVNPSKPKVPLKNADNEALLTHYENLKTRQPSPTSSSSGYGSANSVRSRSSWSADPKNEFPFSYPENELPPRSNHVRSESPRPIAHSPAQSPMIPGRRVKTKFPLLACKSDEQLSDPSPPPASRQRDFLPSLEGRRKSRR